MIEIIKTTAMRGAIELSRLALIAIKVLDRSRTTRHVLL